MSFWSKTLDIAKNVGNVVVSELDKAAAKNREIEAKYKKYSDNDLFKVIKSEGFMGATNNEKGIAGKVLRSRGYSAEEIKNKI